MMNGLVVGVVVLDSWNSDKLNVYSNNTGNKSQALR